MENGITLEKLTRGLQTLERIKQIMDADLRKDSDITVKPDKVSVLHDTLETIADFYPAVRGGRFDNAIQAGSRYSGTYRDIKRHMTEMRGKGTDMTQIVKTLKIISPALENRQKTYIDKIIKIYDIINS